MSMISQLRIRNALIPDLPIANRTMRLAASPAFTLTELLVVIAIITLLIALLLPVLQAANEASRTTQCLSNAGNFGHALQAYLNDNEDTFPVTPWNNPNESAIWKQNSWVSELARYMDLDWRGTWRGPWKGRGGLGKQGMVVSVRS